MIGFPAIIHAVPILIHHHVVECIILVRDAIVIGIGVRRVQPPLDLQSVRDGIRIGVLIHDVGPSIPIHVPKRRHHSGPIDIVSEVGVVPEGPARLLSLVQASIGPVFELLSVIQPIPVGVGIERKGGRSLLPFQETIQVQVLVDILQPVPVGIYPGRGGPTICIVQFTVHRVNASRVKQVRGYQ